MTQQKVIAGIILTLVALIGASTILISDSVTMDPAINFTLWSWLLVTAFLWPFCRKQLRQEWPFIKRQWRLLTALAFFGVSVCCTCSVQALHQENLINAGLINGTTPIFIILLTALCYRKAIGLKKVVGIACGFIAIVLLILSGNIASLKNLSFNVGDAWMLIAVLAWAIYSLLIDTLPKGLSSLSFLWIISVLGAAFLLPFSLWNTFHGVRIVLDHTSFRSLLYTAIFTYIIGYIGWNKGVEMIGAERAGFYLNLFPVFSMILSVIFFHAKIHGYDLVSLALILIGLYLINKGT